MTLIFGECRSRRVAYKTVQYHKFEMPLIFSREEIREFLAEMGYGDLNDDDLERFVKDLRKLIKTESKQRRRRRLGHTGHTRSDFSTSDESNSVGRETVGAEGSTPQSGLETQPRLLVTPKSKLPKKKPKPRLTALLKLGPPMGDRNLIPIRNYGSQDVEKTRPSVKPVTQDLKAVDENFGSSSSSESLSDTDLLCLMEHILKNDLVGAMSGAGDNAEESGKKKMEIPMKIRRDPVALYHWYKTFWDKQKPPGEDRHMQLRWNVRAGTVGRYPCDADGVPINYLRQNSVKPKKKTVCAF
ncbi:unnamed protein product [Allacma fusca]|uniref:Centriolar and ciliogenesis-associated protein HYLS1 C-terminal domain-containing protein n=1 Tax=Allacma fusca TaxID=39272 RepID=A0A8J2NKZ5_9HEXA|nr:unnamed protein product [Allacma fusca]